MRLPLFVFAVPQTDMRSPTVMIGKGKWIFISDSKDSEIELHFRDHADMSFPIITGESFLVEQDIVSISAFIRKKGIERNVTVYVEAV